MNKKIFLFLILLIALVFVLTKADFSSEFSTKTEGLSEVRSSEIVNLKDGDSYDLVASVVKKNINGKEIKMLAYNGMIPGPTIKVKQGSTITINLKNETDVETSLHSHGVRLDSKYDGVIGMDQVAVKPGESFSYKIKFPDAGIFWYHPHFREDYAQELGLYGNYLVESNDSNYLSPVNKEELVTLDDILLDENGQTNFSKRDVDYALMGRFGNVMFTNGQINYSFSANAQDVVRFYFTNVANTRPFRITIPGAQIKLVASDQGKYQKETLVDNVILGPSERQVVDVYFPQAGSYDLVNSNPLQSHVLGKINVSTNTSRESFVSSFNVLRKNLDVVADIKNFEPFFDKSPDKKLRLDINMAVMGHQNAGMHMMPDGTMMSNSGMTMHTPSDGIEWEDTMPQMNKSMNATTEWQIVDVDTGKKNMDINWNFKKGDKVKIEIYNNPNSTHPMQHPIHFHGQRFLVLSVDGIKNTNLVWKDTVLIPAGKKVEILLDVSNPGDWMAHCHIAEHLEASMMFNFKVD